MLGFFFKRKEVVEREILAQKVKNWDVRALRNSLALELRGSLFSVKAKH